MHIHTVPNSSPLSIVFFVHASFCSAVKRPLTMHKFAHVAYKAVCGACCFAAGAAVGKGIVVANAQINNEANMPRPVVHHDHTRTNAEWLTVRNLGKGALCGSMTFRDWSLSEQDPDTDIYAWLKRKGVDPKVLAKFHFDESLDLGPWERRPIVKVKSGQQLTRAESNAMSTALADLRVDIEYRRGAMPWHVRNYTAEQVQAAVHEDDSASHISPHATV